MSTLVKSVKDAVKDAMRAKDKVSLTTLRTITAEFKRIEVDERSELADARAFAVLDKMTKQRRDSVAQYESAGRDDLVGVEQQEMDVISEFLPEALSTAELSQLVADAIAQSGATSLQHMVPVMCILKRQVQVRAVTTEVSTLVKAQLG